MTKVYPKLLFSPIYFEKVFNDKIQKSRSKGLDKMSVEHLKRDKVNIYAHIINKCLNQKFEFTPYLELLKLKGANDFPRAISIPTLRDRFVLYALKEVLHSKFPESINKKLPNKYIYDIKDYISSFPGSYYYKIDIEKFYDTINQDLLIDILENRKLNPIFLYLIKKAIKNPTISANTGKGDKKRFLKQEGIPQGLPISNILAQIYINNFDEEISKRDYLYSRYVDDIILISKEEISNYRKYKIRKALNNINLKINKGKTSYGTVKDGFVFLSYFINENNISISDKNVQIFIRRVASKFTWYKNSEFNKHRRSDWLDDDDRFKEVFIEELNEVITGSVSNKKNYGWLFYFSEMNDVQLLFRIDKIIENFFSQLKSFGYKKPKELKKLVRTYYAIKFGTNRNYLNNYDNYNTHRKKRKFLEFRGIIDPKSHKSELEIDYLFIRFRDKNLKNLEKDVGYSYF